MKTIVIYNYVKNQEIVKEFTRAEDALNYFRLFCDDNNLEYNECSTSAGGIGYDYYIELREE